MIQVREPSGRPDVVKAERLLDFRSGGWVLLLAGVLVALVIIWRLSAIIPTLGNPAQGDGRNIDTYGFNLSTLLVSRDVLVGGGLVRDGLPAMTNPANIPAAKVVFGEKVAGVRKLVSYDRVISVSIGGEVRAYPLWIVQWHEVVNDVLGGEPIVVTYSPLSDSSVVFDRRVGAETLEFGVSGMLCNSNLVLYDRRADAEQRSLWSQLQMRAIAGPAAAAGAQLRPRACTVMTWADWEQAYPAGTVLLPDPDKHRNYKIDPYNTYFNTDRIDFPVKPLPPSDDGWARKAPVIALRMSGGPWTALKMDEILRDTDAGRDPTVRIGAHDIRFRIGGKPRIVSVVLDSAPPELEVVHACWFAWYAAQHP